MENSQYVGFGARFGASMLDTLLFIMVILPIYYLIYGNFAASVEGEITIVTVILQYIFPFIATLIFWIYKSATPGKMLIKAVIVDATTYEKPTTKQLLIRNFGYYLSLLPLGLGYFWVIWDKRKQGWHDKVANTVVIQPKTEKKFIGFGGYLLRGLGLFFILVLLAAITFGVMIQLKMLPEGNIYKVEKLSQSVKEEIIDKELVHNIDDLLYLHPDSSFSFTGEGTLITKQGISIFSTDEEGATLTDFYAFKSIKELVISNIDDLDVGGVDMLEDAFHFKLLFISIYNEEGSLVAEPLISIETKEKENFEKEVLGLWEKSRE